MGFRTIWFGLRSEIVRRLFGDCSKMLRMDLKKTRTKAEPFTNQLNP